MNCQDREKLFLFVQRMLEAHESDRVRRHLAGCTECARAVEEYRKLDSALEDWGVAEPSPWFDAKARARVATSGRNDSGFFGFGRVRTMAAGVAAIVLIVGALVVFNHRKVAEINQPLSSLARPVTITAGQRVPTKTEALRKPLPPEEQLNMDENLSLLEDYEVVANFDALSELPQANSN
jgi:anti-sigma factor RsiW